MINLSEIRIKLFINKIIFNTLNCLKYFIKKKGNIKHNNIVSFQLVI